MKKLLFALAVIFAANTSAQNLIKNGDFESWINTDKNADQWMIFYNKKTATFEYTKDKQQGNCVRLKESNPEGPKARRFQSAVDINIASAGTYEVSFKIKGKVGLRAVVLSLKDVTPATAQSAANHLYSFSKEYPANTEVPEWKEVVAKIVVPDTATFANNYRLNISWSHHKTTAPACDFLLDDVKLVKIK